MPVPVGAQTGIVNTSGQGAYPKRPQFKKTPMTPAEIANLFDMPAPLNTTASNNNVWGSGDMYTGGGGINPRGSVARSISGTAGPAASAAMMDALAASSGGTAGGRLGPGTMQIASTDTGGATTASAGSAKVGGTTSGTDTTAFQFRGSDKAYSPSDVAAMLANPALFQGEYLDSMGLNTPTSSGSMGEFYRLLPVLSQFFLAQQQAPVTDADRQAGLYRELLEQYTTPGGRSANISEMLRSLFGAGQPESGELPTNMLQANYANMAPDDQIRAVNNLLNAGIAGMPGGYGDALSNLFAQAATLYQQSNLNANNGSATNNIPDTAYYEWLQTNPIFRRIAGV